MCPPGRAACSLERTGPGAARLSERAWVTAGRLGSLAGFVPRPASPSRPPARPSWPPARPSRLLAGLFVLPAPRPPPGLAVTLGATRAA